MSSPNDVYGVFTLESTVQTLPDELGREFNQYKVRVTQLGGLMERLDVAREQLFLRQKSIIDTKAQTTPPQDYFSHSFYSEARLGEIVVYIAQEVYRLEGSYAKGARRMGENFATYRRWVKGETEPHGRSKAKTPETRYQGEKPTVSPDSFYGRATRKEIERDVVLNRLEQNNGKIAKTAKSLGINDETLKIFL